MQDDLTLYFDGLLHPVQLTGCSHLSEAFPLLFPHQDYHPGESDEQPLISIVYDGNEYQLTTSWMDETNRYSDKVDVLCDLVAQVALARSFTDLESLYLHAAAVEINGKLVVFPSQFRAGKSFLTACLVAAGHRYLADDVVPVSLATGKACSPGFAPRLRLPLPSNIHPQANTFIKEHMPLKGKRYAYLDLEQGIQVSAAEKMEIGAFVLLEREEGITAELETLPVATVFRQLIKQNFARDIDAAKILSTLTSVVSNAQCIRIRYDRADEAVNLLTTHFKNWPSQSHDLSFEEKQVDTSNFATANSDECFIQHQQAQKIRIEEENFLTSPDGKAIYHLNPVASGIWELLAEPTSEKMIVSTLCAAFPEVNREVIESDVAEILSRFQSKNLVMLNM